MDRNFKLLFMTLIFILIPNFAFLEDFGFRQNTTLTFIFNHDSYVQPYIVDTSTLIGNGKLQSDCEDLRFTNTTDGLYNYWIEGPCDSSTTKVYVDIDESVTTGNKTVLMYYGDPLENLQSNFNLTFSNIVIPNGDFEGDASGNPADWTIVEAVGSIDVSQDRAVTGTNSTKYVDDSGADQPKMTRSFSAISYTNIFEFSINVDSISTDGPFIRIGGDTGDFAVLSMIFNSDNSIDIFPDGSETALNESFTFDEWINVSIGSNFSSGKNYIWINGNFTGAHNFRNLGGAPSNMDDVAFQAGGASITTYYVDAIRIREWENPEPFVFFGSEETPPINFDFTFAPASPHVFEEVTFNSTSELNITNWWWDFGDGSSLFSTTVNTTTHTYSSGGEFTVNLTGLNGTFNNISRDKSITIFEPTITIWANDTINNILIENFKVTASNSTDSFEFDAIGPFAIWNFTNGPFGSVGILIEKNGFNHTTETIQITNSSDVNFTASVFPALFIFRVRDAEFTNVIVPAKLTMTNNSLTVVKENDWESIYANTTIVVNVGDKISTSGKFTGQIWKVDLAGSSNELLARLNISFTLHNEDLDESTIVYFKFVSGQYSLDETNYIYLNKDGTYKVLDSGGGVLNTGVFAFFPALLESEIDLENTAGATGTSSGVVVINQPASDIEFAQPSGALTGNVTILFERNIDGFFGFLDNTYQPNYIYHEGVVSTNIFNQTVFMINDDTSFSSKILVLGDKSQAISGAKVSVFRFDDNGDLEELSSSVTDASGNTPLFYFKKNAEVFAFAIKGTSTTDGLQKLFITQNGDVFQLFIGVTVLQANPIPFDNVLIFLSPDDGIALTENTTQLFNFSVIDLDSLLLNTTVHLFSTDLSFSHFSSSASPNSFTFEQIIAIPVLNQATASIFLSYNITRADAEGGSSKIVRVVEYLVYPDFSFRNINDFVDDLGKFKYLIGIIIMTAGYLGGKYTGLGATIGVGITGFVPPVTVLISTLLTILFMWSDTRK